MDLVEACRKFIAIDSTPHGGSLEIAQFAAELCRAAGLHTEVELETQNGLEQANVIARPVGSNGATPPRSELLLQTHLDTVDPGPYALWTRTGSNPFNASLYQDAIYGLGAAEAKLDFLCKLKAVEALGARKWRQPFVLAGTFGEELGMAGAVKLIRKKKIAAKMALVGEPTELKLISAAKGLVGVQIEIPFSEEELEYRRAHDAGESTSTQSRMFMGRAAHSSAPHLGESAIAKMLDYLTKLPSGIVVMEMEGGTSFNTVPANAVLEIDMVGGVRDSVGAKISRVMKAIVEVEADFARYPAEGFEPSIPTLNIGLIRTRNDHVVILGCARMPPSVEEAVSDRWMDALGRACAEAGAKFHLTEMKRPFRTSGDSEIVQACRHVLSGKGLDAGCYSLSSTNEANVFSRFGVECVVIGPGRGVGNSHAPNEHVKISELEGAISFYKGVIERLCL